MNQTPSSPADHLNNLRDALKPFHVENELFDQVIQGIKTQISQNSSHHDLLSLVVDELGKKIKNAFQDIAVQQLRIE